MPPSWRMRRPPARRPQPGTLSPTPGSPGSAATARLCAGQPLRDHSRPRFHERIRTGRKGAGMGTPRKSDVPGDEGGTAVADSFPTRYLPRPEVRDMPDAPRQLLAADRPGDHRGRGRAGLGRVHPLPLHRLPGRAGLRLGGLVGLATQFVLNMEIERYTLATGETALTGFSRYWRHWGLVFAVLTYFANLWPGLGDQLRHAGQLPVRRRAALHRHRHAGGRSG